jgi:hypothetical protein
MSVKALCDGLPLLCDGAAGEADVMVLVPWGLATWWGVMGNRRSRCTSICHSSRSSCDIYLYIFFVIFNIVVSMMEALQQGIMGSIKFLGCRMDETLVLSLTDISFRVSLDSGFSTAQHHHFNIVLAMGTKK